jgi:hypothetical protein
VKQLPIQILFFRELPQINNIPHILQEVHFLFDIVTDVNSRIGFVSNDQIAPAEQANRYPILQFIENLTGSFNTTSLQLNQLLRNLDAAIVDFMREVGEVLPPQFHPLAVYLHLVRPELVRPEDRAVVLMNCLPMLFLMLSPAIPALLASSAYALCLL